jgi:hypothetical protein
LLTTLALLASLFGGLAKGPWWFWLVGGGAIAILSVTDPTRQRAPDTDFFGAGTLSPLIGDLKTVSAGWLASAAAFAAGSVLSWALPL